MIEVCYLSTRDFIIFCHSTLTFSHPLGISFPNSALLRDYPVD